MRIGMLVFPNITATDYVAPADLLVRIPGASLELVWKHTDPIRTELGWEFRATMAMAESPQFDMIVVPGGPGIAALFEDKETVDFLAHQGKGARWIVGICTGPLLLGVAGLLEGHEATCHWASHELLTLVGAKPINARVVVDRNRVTGAGVTSGIDCALRVIALAADEDTARRVQLFAEYDPQPPFDSGSTEKAPAHIVEAMRAAVAGIVTERREILERINRHAKVPA